jgi:hypothetical protein
VKKSQPEGWLFSAGTMKNYFFIASLAPSTAPLAAAPATSLALSAIAGAAAGAAAGSSSSRSGSGGGGASSGSTSHAGHTAHAGHASLCISGLGSFGGGLRGFDLRRLDGLRGFLLAASGKANREEGGNEDGVLHLYFLYR